MAYNHRAVILFVLSVCRREIREAGMTLIFDAKKTNPQPQLYKALMTLQVRRSHVFAFEQIRAVS